MYASSYPDLIRQLRGHLQLTQEQLAQQLGVTFATVNGWENGKHRPSPLAARAVLALARQCGLASDAGATGRRG